METLDEWDSEPSDFIDKLVTERPGRAAPPCGPEAWRRGGRAAWGWGVGMGGGGGGGGGRGGGGGGGGGGRRGRANRVHGRRFAVRPFHCSPVSFSNHRAWKRDAGGAMQRGSTGAACGAAGAGRGRLEGRRAGKRRAAHAQQCRRASSMQHRGSRAKLTRPGVCCGRAESSLSATQQCRQPSQPQKHQLHWCCHPAAQCPQYHKQEAVQQRRPLRALPAGLPGGRVQHPALV